MRFLIDENLPEALVSAAEARGHTAAWVRERMPGAPDAAILARLRGSGETLVTRDIRFANLILASMTTDVRLAGAVLIREQRMANPEAAWGHYLRQGAESERAVVVVQKQGVRIRRVE